MTNIHLFLKNGADLVIENLTAINVISDNDSATFRQDDFEMLRLTPAFTYNFIGASETISISGADLLLLRFVKT